MKDDQFGWGMAFVWTRVRGWFKGRALEPFNVREREIETFCRNLLAAWENEPVDSLPHRVRDQLPFARMALNRLSEKKRACEAGKSALASYYAGLLAVASTQLRWDGDLSRHNPS